MNRTLGLLGVALTLSATLPHAALRAQGSPQAARTVYVTVTDQNGAPVGNLTGADFLVKEGGKTAKTVRAEIATDPMQIAVIVDDNGTGLFRAPLARFVQRLDGRMQMAISSVVGQTMKVVDYTNRLDLLNSGIASLNARPGTPDGGQLLEGIYESAKELRKREAPRPVIIALTVGGEEHSTVVAHHVLDELRRSGATLYVFSVASSALRGTVAVQRPSGLLQENLNLQKVLGEGPKQSGGRHTEIVATAGGLNDLQQLASDLMQQYRVSYALAEGGKRSDKISVAVSRKGLAVHAPTRVPN